MASVHLGRFSRNGLNLNADLLAFLGALDRLVIHLNARHNTNVYKLQHTTS